MSGISSDKIRVILCKEVRGLSAKIELLQISVNRREYCTRYTNDIVIKENLRSDKERLGNLQEKYKLACWCRMDPVRRYKQYCMLRDTGTPQKIEEFLQVG